jgi:epidermal growth factor receptor substrate 15
VQAVVKLGASTQAGQAGTVSGAAAQQGSDLSQQSFLETLQSASDTRQDQSMSLVASAEPSKDAAKMAGEKSGSERKKSADDSSEDETGASVNAQDQTMSAVDANQIVLEQVQSAPTTPVVPMDLLSAAATQPAQTQVLSTETTANVSLYAPAAVSADTSANQSVSANQNFDSTPVQLLSAQTSSSESALSSADSATGQYADQESGAQDANPASALTTDSDAQAELSKALAEIQANLNASDDSAVANSEASATAPENFVQASFAVQTVDSSATTAQTAIQNQALTAPASSEAVVELLKTDNQTELSADSVASSVTNTQLDNAAEKAPVKAATTSVAKKSSTASAVPAQTESINNGNQPENTIAAEGARLQAAQSDKDSSLSTLLSGNSQKQSGDMQQEPEADGKSSTPDSSAAAGQSVSASAFSSVVVSQASTPKASQKQSVTVAESGTSHSSVQESGSLISSAKLIQSASQAEMRVGMQSSEFGNISISASTTRDAVTAQISVDHTELAKTLSSQLSDFQANSSNVQMNVQVGMHGSGSSTTSNQSYGGQTGTMDGSASQSNSNGRQSEQVYGHNSTATAVSAESEATVGLVAAQFGKQSANVSGRLDVSA